ncbi:MAG: hypothetical protein KKB59_19185 [Spirochaetes bacterium]|nr:hypothetical protein [Spirochaetota bacterium]
MRSSEHRVAVEEQFQSVVGEIVYGPWTSTVVVTGNVEVPCYRVVDLSGKTVCLTWSQPIAELISRLPDLVDSALAPGEVDGDL